MSGFSLGGVPCQHNLVGVDAGPDKENRHVLVHQPRQGYRSLTLVKRILHRASKPQPTIEGRSENCSRTVPDWLLHPNYAVDDFSDCLRLFLAVACIQDDDPDVVLQRRESQDEPSTARVKGHGRNGADDYASATRVAVAHQELTSGQPCPSCSKGKVYTKKQPALLVRIVGRAPLQPTLYELQRLRCNLCGETFSAAPPPGVGERKYDATAAAMLGLLKYGTGLPFYRIERLHKSLGVPLPRATQWDIVEDASRRLAFAFEELVRQGAQGDVVYNDDTFMRILSLMKENESRDPDKERTGMFTTGIVATNLSHRIALFMTGRKHAGENLFEVLKERASHRGPPIQMCDGLDRNLPKDLEVIVSNCMVHGRRKFVDVAASFPAECGHVLEALRVVFHNDALAREQGLDADARLELHQRRSGPVLEQLHEWLEARSNDTSIEPNSGLGSAIRYMRKRWDRLTRFLHVAGAPIDSNIVERSLKRAILNRKNAMFYKTEHGAHVGDIFMSLIHTCELNGVNPLDYLAALLDHPDELQAEPFAWMPWNYRSALATSSP